MCTALPPQKATDFTTGFDLQINRQNSVIILSFGLLQGDSDALFFLTR
jgi:hypothetical protein